MMHAGKCQKHGREEWDPEGGGQNNELTFVVKPHLNVASISKTPFTRCR